MVKRPASLREYPHAERGIDGDPGLIAQLLSLGKRHDDLETDPDLDPIRELSGFKFFWTAFHIQAKADALGLIGRV